MNETKINKARAISAARLALAISLAAMAAASLVAACTNPLATSVRSIALEAASPHMTMASSAGALANGSGFLSFPDTGVLSSSTINLTISNSGKKDLSINLASIAISMSSGTSAGSFTLKTPPIATIPAGNSGNCTICFTPQAVGANSATIVFPTNDVDNPKFTFTAKGNGTNQAQAPVVVGGNAQCIPSGLTTVTITNPNPSGTIYYSLDGSIPSVAAVGATTMKYTSPFAFNFTSTGNGTVRAFAVVAGLINSPVTTATFSMTQISQPTLSPAAQTFFSATTPQPTFSISSSTTNASIAFTIDGTAPNLSSGPVTLSTGTSTPTANSGTTYLISNGASFYCSSASGTVTLNAIAWVTNGSGDSTSTSASASYTYQMSPPTWAGVQPVASYYVGAQSVTLSCVSGSGGTAGIYYSTVALPPVTSGTGTLYAGVGIPVPVATEGSVTNETIQAVAHETNWQDSAVMSGVFNVCGPGLFDTSEWDRATWQ